MREAALMVLQLILNSTPWVFKPTGECCLQKFDGFVRRTSPYSAYASIQIQFDILRLKKNLYLVVGGKEAVWMEWDVGPVQLDPQQADYLLQGGIKKYLEDGRYWGILLDHPCFHQIDTLVVRSLYWNKVKFVYGNYRRNIPLAYRKLRYHFEFGSFLRHKDIPWLTKGLDFQFDFYLKAEYAFFKVKNLKIYSESELYTGISMNYNLHPYLEINIGISRKGEKGEGRFYIGMKPVDRKTFREAEGAPYAGIKILY